MRANRGDGWWLALVQSSWRAALGIEMSIQEHAGTGTDDSPVLLFDGVCVLCNWAVDFVLRHERAPVFRFAALQGEVARAMLERVSAPSLASTPQTLVVISKGRLFVRSRAALEVARQLRLPWRLAFAFVIVPRPVRDFVYGFVARRRFRWFGALPSCRVPAAHERSRFLLDSPTARV